MEIKTYVLKYVLNHSSIIKKCKDFKTTFKVEIGLRGHSEMTLPRDMGVLENVILDDSGRGWRLAKS